MEVNTLPSKQLLGGRYRLLRQLGKGAFGQTFLAEDLHLPNHPACVIKQLQPQSTDANSMQTARRLFDTEARVLYQLGNHSQIPRLLAHFEENQEFYLAQEFIAGNLIAEELGMDVVWSEAQVISLLHDLLQVLAFVHQQQVIHRDIKPANLIRRKVDGKIVVIDFGAVKRVSQKLDRFDSGEARTIAIGTEGYMPSEQLGGNPHYCSDVYALGIIAIQALTGLPPALLETDIRSGEILWKPAVPAHADLVSLLNRMVRYDFRDRFSTAIEVLEALWHLPQFAGQTRPPISQSAPVQDSQQALSPPPVVRPPRPAPPPTQVFGMNEAVQKDGDSPAGDEVIWMQPLNPMSGNSIVVELGQAASTIALTETLPPHLQPQPLDDELEARSSEGTADAGSLAAARNLLERSPALDVAAVPATTLTSPGSKDWLEILRRWPVVAIAATCGMMIPLVQSAWFTKSSELALSKPELAERVSGAVKPTLNRLAWEKIELPDLNLQVNEILKQANRLRKAGQNQDALDLYYRAIALNPDLPAAHWGRCAVLNELQQPLVAIAACEDALALQPEYPEALTGKGFALEQQQRYAEALELYNQAIALQSDYAEAWNRKGHVLLATQQAAEAVSAFDRATALEKDWAEAWYGRGKALWQVGQQEAAIAALDQAIQLQPNYEDAIALRQQIQ